VISKKSKTLLVKATSVVVTHELIH